MEESWIKALQDHFVYKKAFDKKGEAPEFSRLALDGSVSHANCRSQLLPAAFQAPTS
jgi:hypothetical protein